MKWREWKEWIEAHGVKDDDEIEYIDCVEPRDIGLREPQYGHGPRWYIW